MLEEKERIETEAAYARAIGYEHLRVRLTARPDPKA